MARLQDGQTDHDKLYKQMITTTRPEDNAASVVFICYGNRGVCWREEVSHTGSPTSLYDIEATGTLRAQERTDRVINEGRSQHVSIAS